MHTDCFEDEVKRNISAQAKDVVLKRLASEWFIRACEYKYCYGFTWLGLPMIQLPQDFVALQEIIWRVRPDFIIETGIARGGSTVFYASMLELLGGEGKVIAIEIDLRPWNRRALESHPMYKRIKIIEGSSVDRKIVDVVHEIVGDEKKIMVCLDSNHTHEHVLEELNYYAVMVSPGSYCVVFDTGIEDFPESMYSDKPWGRGNNPGTAVKEFLSKNDDFIIDRDIENKLLITGAPSGFLRRISR